METWQKLLQASITKPGELTRRYGIDPQPLEEVVEQYPMRVNPYYLGLIKEVDDPIWQQAVPSVKEVHDSVCYADPLEEENQSPVPNLVHRYPDRVLFLVCSECAMYCRFCTRKRKVGGESMLVNRDTIERGLDYMREHPEIRDVIVSGGDPLLLSDEKLDWILTELRAIPHVEIIRIGSRIPVVLPQRITMGLIRVLRKHQPIYLNTHFNHPDEITETSAKACARLADAGIPLGNQTVLLRGVNDDPAVMKRLMQRLLAIRVRPYYILPGRHGPGHRPLPDQRRGRDRDHPRPARPHLGARRAGLRHRRPRWRRQDSDSARLPAEPRQRSGAEKLSRRDLHLRQCPAATARRCTVAGGQCQQYRRLKRNGPVI